MSYTPHNHGILADNGQAASDTSGGDAKLEGRPNAAHPNVRTYSVPSLKASRPGHRTVLRSQAAR